MADHFQGSGSITIQPGSSNEPYSFNVTIATSSTLNNGHLPYGSTVHKCTVKAHRKDGSTQYGSSDLISGSSLNGNGTMVRLSFSTAMTYGLYHLTLNVTASVNGSTASPFKRELDFNRVYVRDR